MAKPDVSVVIPTRNRPELLRGQLRSLAEQSLDAARFEVIVIDDGAGEETSAVLAEAKRSAGYALKVGRGGGKGAAHARNQGWRMATAQLVAFTDDDCVTTLRWLEELVKAADPAKDLIVQGATELAPGATAEVGPFSRVLEITTPNPHYATCNILYPRSLLERLGGFDEAFRSVTGEDTDLGWRARGAGAEYRFAEQAVVHHAVVQLGPVGKLRWALRWSDAMQALAKHPGLRSTLTWGLFWKRSHALLAVALAGTLVSRRFPPAALLVLPYARSLRARCLIEGYSLGFMPYLAVYDLMEMVAAGRGAIRYRVAVL